MSYIIEVREVRKEKVGERMSNGINYYDRESRMDIIEDRVVLLYL